VGVFDTFVDTKVQKKAFYKRKKVSKQKLTNFIFIPV